MSRSKKDGRKGGAHKRTTLRKWQITAQRRQAARSNELRRVVLLETDVSEADLRQEHAEIMSVFYHDYEELSGVDFGWTAYDEQNWQDFQYCGHEGGSDSLDDDEYCTESERRGRRTYQQYDWDRDFGWDEAWEPINILHGEVHLAIDRMVRQYGLDHTREHAYVIATMFDAPLDSVQSAINLTPAAYAARWIVCRTR